MKKLISMNNEHKIIIEGRRKITEEIPTFYFEVTLTGYDEPCWIVPKIDWSQVDFVE